MAVRACLISTIKISVLDMLCGFLLSDCMEICSFVVKFDDVEVVDVKLHVDIFTEPRRVSAFFCETMLSQY